MKDEVQDENGHVCGRSLCGAHCFLLGGLKSATPKGSRHTIWRPPTAENDSPLPAFITPKSRALQSRRQVCRLPLTWVLRGEFSPSPAAIHQSFSLWFPRCCVASAWKCLPPFKSTAAFTRRALSCPLPRGARPRRREQYGRAAPARREFYEGCRRLCFRSFLRLACRQVLPISSPLLFPAEEEKGARPVPGGLRAPVPLCGPAPPGLACSLSAVRPPIVAARQGSSLAVPALAFRRSLGVAARQKGVSAYEAFGSSVNHRFTAGLPRPFPGLCPFR